MKLEKLTVKMEARGDRFDLFTFFPRPFRRTQGHDPQAASSITARKWTSRPKPDASVIASLEPALKVPSRNECRFCDIARTECPERIEG